MPHSPPIHCPIRPSSFLPQSLLLRLILPALQILALLPFQNLLYFVLTVPFTQLPYLEIIMHPFVPSISTCLRNATNQQSPTFLAPGSGFMVLLLLSRFSRVRLCATHRRQPNRLPRPWDPPAKNTGVGCHFLLQCMKVKSESEVTQLCLTPSNPMDCSLPGFSIHGIFQARVLEWDAIAFSG